MNAKQIRSRVMDVVTGLVAICLVVGMASSIQSIGSDLRALFALTAAAFFLAGMVRAQSVRHNVWSHALLVSCPGLLGTGAMILNDGLNRLGIPITLAFIAYFVTAAGIATRRWWATSRQKSWLLGLALVGAVSVLTFLLVPVLAVHASLRHVDYSAPAFSLTAFDGTTVRSTDLRGHVTVLAFWATWCMPCHWELPEIERVYKKFEGNPQVIFWAVDAHGDGETAALGKRYLDSKKLALPGAFDSGGAGHAYGLQGLPMIVILDQEGQVRTVHYGYDASEHIEAVLSKSIESLLRAERGTA